MIRFQPIMLFIPFLFISIIALLSCTEKQKSGTVLIEDEETITYPIKKELPVECQIIETYPENESVIPPIAEEMHKQLFVELDELRQLFEGSILENNLEILRILTRSQIYIDYLKRTFHRDAPFETLEEFWTTQPIPTELYRPIFDGFIEAPEPDDFAYLHRNLLNWKATVLHTYVIPICARDPIDYFLNKPLHLRGGPVKKTDLTNGTLEKWVTHYSDGYESFRSRKRKKFITFLNTDKKKIRGYFNMYDVDDALIWLAIQDPNLIGLILSSTVDEAMFIGWINYRDTQ
ncbi:hypothetical protein C6501_14820 [Candidatus Poribacteria bacterium]|nr:MAG: hypothetical protein C6501_14820 [Candidatus Poribacteria bacterium]